jgi:hypothetical protein
VLKINPVISDGDRKTFQVMASILPLKTLGPVEPIISLGPVEPIKPWVQ